MKLKPLKHPDNLHLQAALGWLGLNDPLEAGRELDNIRAEWRAHPEVLKVRMEIYYREKSWAGLYEIANTLVREQPSLMDAWILRSFALHELDRTQDAYDDLLLVSEEFPKVWVIPYNLACYCSVMRRFPRAQEWLKRAMAIDEKTVQREAIDDPDLQPLWDSMSGTMWKRE